MEKMFQLPPFYKENPPAWFVRVDCAFNTAKILNDKEKFNLFVANVDNYGLLALISEYREDNKGIKSYYGIKQYVITKFKTLGKVEFCKLFEDGSALAMKSDKMDDSKAPTVLKLPRFRMENPERWFEQIEATFALANITSEKEKCVQFMANLDPNVLKLIKDMLPIKSISEIKMKMLTACKAEGTSQSLKEEPLKPASVVWLEKRIVELEKNNLSLHKRVTALEKKTKKPAPNVPLETRVVALEEKLKDCAVQVKTQFEELVASTTAAQKNIAELESKMVELLFLAPSTKTVQIIQP